MAYNDSLETRRTLLSRLRNLDDQESWRSFFDRYWQLLYNVARQSGLGEAAAQDVVQETVICVARAMPDFRYDPARGSFKQWLLRITRRRIIDQLRRTYRELPKSDLSPEALEDDEVHAESIADPVVERIDAAWELEWEQRVLAEAVARVKNAVNPKHFQVFDYCVLKEWSVAKVAATLDLNAAQVYLARHRVSLAVKKAARQIRDDWVSGVSHHPSPTSSQQSPG